MTDQPTGTQRHRYLLPGMVRSTADVSRAWILDAPLYLTRGGSWSYGLQQPDSDLDLKGFVMPPARMGGLGLSNFEQVQCGDIIEPDSLTWDVIAPPARATSTALPVEATVFGFRKFVQLAAGANPNILEMLFVRPDDVLHCDLLFSHLLSNREVFLTKKAEHTYSGYAVAQLRRIESHRQWLLNPPKAPPQRVDFGLSGGSGLSKADLAEAQAAVQKQLDSWELDLDGLDKAQRTRIANILEEQWLAKEERYAAAAEALGLKDALRERLVNERRFKDAQRHWKSFQDWKTNRNEHRSALEQKCGYDAKHAAHCLRLVRQGREILQGLGLRVHREEAGDAEELREIRAGDVAYDVVMQKADDEMQALKVAAKASALPFGVDHEKLEALVEATLREAYDLGEVRDA